jgi:hypothetical protein
MVPGEEGRPSLEQRRETLACQGTSSKDGWVEEGVHLSGPPKQHVYGRLPRDGSKNSTQKSRPMCEHNTTWRMCLPNAPLRISDLDLATNDGNPATNLYLPMLRASSATLTTLSIEVNGDVLMVLAGIELPLLHNLALSLVRENEMSGVGAADFIAAQRAVKKLYVSWDIGPLPLGTLPNLQELDASIDWVKQLVPGRPVEQIVIRPSRTGNNQDWCWEEIAKSTAVVRKLYLDRGVGNRILNIGMVEQMVTKFPFLEILGLSLHDDVRWLLLL